MPSCSQGNRSVSLTFARVSLASIVLCLRSMNEQGQNEFDCETPTLVESSRTADLMVSLRTFNALCERGMSTTEAMRIIAAPHVQANY